MIRLALQTKPEVEILEIEEVDTDRESGWKLIIFNDDVNTFDNVIQALVEVCEHTFEQAEQCALITHYKGKCIVKNGSFDDLAPRRNSLCERGLSAEIYE